MESTTPSAWKPLAAAFAVLVAGALLLGAAFDAHAGDRRKMTPGQIDAAALYHNYCSVCHGDAGDGNSRAKNSLIPPPADFTSPALQGRLTREYIAAIVKHGKAKTAMVGWKTQLNDAEIAAVSDYVRVAFVDHAGDAALKRGRTLYGHLCVGCHAVDGSGQVSVADAGGPPPRNFASPAVRREVTRERLVASIAVGRKGTAMTGFAGQLSAADIDAVADFVQTSLMTGQMAGAISGVNAHAGRQQP